MTQRKAIACRYGCGATLSSHEARHHYVRCPSTEAVRLTPRKCENPKRECTGTFTYDPKHPNKRFCGPVCVKENTAFLERGKRQKTKARLLAETADAEAAAREDAARAAREAAQMAVIRAREAAERAEAERLGEQILANRERDHSNWLACLGVAA